MEDVKKILLELEKTSDIIEITHKIKPSILGKDGIITKMMQKIKDLEGDAKKEYAKSINDLKLEAEEKICIKIAEIESQKLLTRLESEKIDHTLPIETRKIGQLHPITKASSEIITILQKYGFSLFEGPEIELVENNFTKLNIPEGHPARQMQDSFYIEENGSVNKEYILRTHTSNTQIRAISANGAPIRGISFGKVFRHDSDATHSPMFHQIECFAIDENIDMSHLNFVINALLSEFFEREVNTRFRPSFFPFTEPSAEVDISYTKKDGKIFIEKSDQYMEIGGSGMIHPRILENCGVDPKKYQGFAFGFGVDRMAMLKYGIADIRGMYF